MKKKTKRRIDWLPYILINCCCNQVNLQRQRMLFIDANGERPLGTAGGSKRSFFFEIFDYTHAAWHLKCVASGEIKLLSLGFPTSRVVYALHFITCMVKKPFFFWQVEWGRNEGPLAKWNDKKFFPRFHQLVSFETCNSVDKWKEATSLCVV